jgi:hypothetical protein
MKAYVINLDKRPDRLARISAHLAELGIPMERIKACLGAEHTEIERCWRKQGRSKEARWRAEFGCYTSHINGALSKAIYRNEFPCIILEDDCVLSEVPEPEPGMVYLGGYESSKGLFGFHAIMYNTIEDALKFFEYAIHARKSAIDAVGNRYRIAYPDRVSKYSKGFIATQLKDFSDIEGCVVSRSPAGTVSKH